MVASPNTGAPCVCAQGRRRGLSRREGPRVTSGASGLKAPRGGHGVWGACGPGLGGMRCLGAPRGLPSPGGPAPHQLQQHEHPDHGAHEVQVRAQRGPRGAGALRGAAGPRAHFGRELGHRGSARLPEVASAAAAAPPAVGPGSRAAPPGGTRSRRRSRRSARRRRRDPAPPGAAPAPPRPRRGPAPLTLRSPPAGPAWRRTKSRRPTSQTGRLRPQPVKWCRQSQSR